MRPFFIYWSGEMIKAIETKYKGYRFRSRLEARWAVFFDAIGLDWDYEAEGYDLDGVYYLPDFKVTLLNGRAVYYEIKPENKHRDPKFSRFVEKMKDKIGDNRKLIDQEMERPIDPVGYILSGDPMSELLIPADGESCLSGFLRRDSFNVEDEVKCYSGWPMVCVACGNIKAGLMWGGTDFDSGYYNCDCCHKWDIFPKGEFAFGLGALNNDGSKNIIIGHNFEKGEYLDKVKNAAVKARSARFEHGENGGESCGNKIPEQENKETHLPQGWYAASISNAELKTSRSGNGQYINVKYVVTKSTHQGDYQGSVVSDIINVTNRSRAAERFGHQKFSSLLRAIGLTTCDDTDQLVGASCAINLTVTQSHQYGIGNEIIEFRPIPQSLA